MTIHLAELPVPAAVRTACPYCGVGCGVIASSDGHGGAAIAGDPDHPANFGRLCSKGSALGETLALDQRLLYPEAYGARVTWDTALDAVAGGLQQTIDRHGPQAVAFYLSGQLLTEDYYVANKLLKGFIGSSHVDTNSRLCMASSVAGHRRAFGSDTVPGCYADLDEADLLVLVGSNAAWCHPVLFQRMLRNKAERGAKIVVIDPRQTATADEADLFLPIKPGADTTLFSGLLVHLAETGRIDQGYVASHTSGFIEALERARSLASDGEATAARAGLSAADVARFFEWFAATGKVVTCFSQGVNQSAQGTDKVNAIINCHLATGRIGKPGMGPFSLTGQPNAMGGREVGGLANMLAAHMGFGDADVDRVRRFWNAPRLVTSEGHKAVAMFDAIDRGEIKALWVMATNPAVSMPRADAVRRSLRKLDLLIVSENVRTTDTMDNATHIRLPAAAWGEKSGTVTNSERRITRQRAFLPAPGEAQPDWWIVSEVGKRLGFADAFPYRSAADIFREHAALSTFENAGTRDFDLGPLRHLSDADYERFEPILWPVRAELNDPVERFFADGGFYTADRRGRFIAPAAPRLSQETSPSHPILLLTGRIRDQWHTMTRTGLSPRLSGHTPVPFLAVHPHDAERLALAEGSFARISNAHGSAILEVRLDAGQPLGTVFAPIHWSDQNAASSRVGALVQSGVDPFSGQPELKATPVAIEPFAFERRGFILSRRAVAMPDNVWWARLPLNSGFATHIASDAAIDAHVAHAHTLFSGAQLAEFHDDEGGLYRCAAFVDGKLHGALFVANDIRRLSFDALRAAFEADAVATQDRKFALSGFSPEGLEDAGPLVCACFGVAQQSIVDCIVSRRADSVESIGQVLKAGTNCGSCIPELRRMLNHESAAHAG